jgi:predicted amidophosphoribosyltransferase
LCWSCAAPDLEPRPGFAGDRCDVCDQRLEAAVRCRNYWCGRDDRGFDVVWAIGVHRSVLRQVIAQYKYRGATSWASVLGRVLAGYLAEHSPWFEEFELLIPSPGHPDRPGLADPVERIVDAAASVAGDLWPFDVGPRRCLIKTAATMPLMEVGSPEARRLWAACDLRPALEVTEPERVHGRQVLVIDDILTDGSTLREVALALRQAGAAGVSGLVFARQPWRT